MAHLAYPMPAVLVLHESADVHHLVGSALAERFRVVSVFDEREALFHLDHRQVQLVICAADQLHHFGKLTRRLQSSDVTHRAALLLLLESDEDPLEIAPDDIERDYLFLPLRPAELVTRCNKLLVIQRSLEQLAALTREHNEQLEQSENRFRLMVESIEDYAMFMVDLSGAIISWNRGAERLTGYTEAEAIGQRFSMLYPREELDERHALHELSMAARYGRYEEEGKRVRKDGTTYLAQITVWRVDREGEVIGFAKITRDITARRQAEQAIKESEARFRTITDAMPQMVWSTSPNGNYDYFNKQWYDFTGVSLGEINGGNWNSILHPEDQDRALKAWQHSLSTGEIYEIQYRLRHHSGSYRWALGRALPVRNEDGAIVRWMGTLTDIHEQKETEEALKDAGRRKDEFLAMLAHELRNPLAPVRNSTLLLHLLEKSDERAVNAVNVIDRQVRHMTRLIDDLLDVARISRGKIMIRKEHLELLEVVRDTVEDFAADYDTKGVRLRMEAGATCLHLAGDRTRIAQALGNLLHNALKFTDAGGEVVVRLDRERSGDVEMAVVQVMDSGAGIAPDIIAALFHPFIQAEQELARSKGGLGLGLALVKGFVELHGGSVEACSEGSGRGSTFILRLPLVQAEWAEASEVHPPLPMQPQRILVIEDNADMRDTLQTLLILHGHEVFAAGDGVNGLALAREVQPILVLCDIGLPGECDGFVVARSMREDPELASIRLVALSGYGQEQDRQRARQSGFDHHLLKPIDFAELSAVIAQAGQSEDHR